MRIELKYLFGLLFIWSSFSSLAQYQNVMIDEGPSSGGPEEPAICIAPWDTNLILAGANIKRSYRSTDGGKTWTYSLMKSKYGVWGDPCIVADQKKNFYFFHLSDPKGTNWQSEEILDRIVCQRSKRKGKKWTRGTYTGLAHPKDQDKEWAAINPDNGHLIVTWTQFDDYGSKDPKDQSNILFSKSTNKGRKWSAPVQINEHSGDCLDDDLTTEGAVPAFGPNGEIYVAWAHGENIYFDYSLDGGTTWLDKDIVASDMPGGWTQKIPGIMRCNGMPVTVCDLSNGPHRGTIYINWTDQRNGEDDTDVFFSKSTDGGKTWSPAKRINDDKTITHQFLTWMTVDPSTGYVYCVFYDRRNYPDNKTDVFLAMSKDGGATWTNEKISNSPFTPEESVFFGDYNNISAVKGSIRPIWTRLENGKLSIWTALINKK